jgi:hypothetical protein
VPLGIILPASVIDVDLQPDPRWEHHARLDALPIFTQPAPGIARDATIPAYHASMKIAKASSYLRARFTLGTLQPLFPGASVLARRPRLAVDSSSSRPGRARGARIPRGSWI